MNLTTNIIIALIYGIALGVITILLSKKLILNRTEESGKVDYLAKPVSWVVAIIVGVGSSVAVGMSAETTALEIRNLILLIPIFSIAVVDATVRKIPNTLLLFMLITQIVYGIYESVDSQSAAIFGKMLMGAIVATIACIIPSVLKIPMGAGDIKYCAMIGFTIYMYGFFQAMILMAIFVALFFICLKIKKKGGLKTQIPMGPFLSIGTVISMCFSVFDFIG